jgi:hypothetical protein
LVVTCHAVKIRENHLEVAAELPHDLPAGAAWRRRLLGVGDDRDSSEGTVTFRESLEDGYALGAERQPVGRVLDIAAVTIVPSAVSSAAPTLKCE